ITLLGFPSGLTAALEVGVFNAVTTLVATLDSVSVAAHAVALNTAALTYTVPLGIGSAGAVSVGRAVGCGDEAAGRRAGWTAIFIAVIYSVATGLSFLFLPKKIATLYTDDNRVVASAVGLLAIAALFQLTDGVQTVATGALRGLGDTTSALTANLV